MSGLTNDEQAALLSVDTERDAIGVVEGIVAARERAAAAQALRDAAKAARAMHDPVAPDCEEWAAWMEARAARYSRKGDQPERLGRYTEASSGVRGDRAWRCADCDALVANRRDHDGTCTPPYQPEQEATDEVCSCGNRYDGDNFCMRSACQWEV